jgi:hypothetical protein
MGPPGEGIETLVEISAAVEPAKEATREGVMTQDLFPDTGRGYHAKVTGKPARRRQLKALIKEEHLDGVGLSVTIKEDFTNRDLDDLARGLDFRWVWKGVRGHPGAFWWGLKIYTLKLRILR